MSLLKKSNKQRTEAGRKRRMGTRREQVFKDTFTRHALVSFLLYLCFGVLATFICFVGLSSAGPLVQRDQVSRIRITAEIPFNYVSQIETGRRLEAVRQKVPPVFRLDLEPYRNFRSYIEQFMQDMLSFAEVPENTPENLAKLEESEIQSFIGSYAAGNPFNLRPSDHLFLVAPRVMRRLANQIGNVDETRRELRLIFGQPR